MTLGEFLNTAYYLSEVTIYTFEFGPRGLVNVFSGQCFRAEANLPDKFISRKVRQVRAIANELVIII